MAYSFLYRTDGDDDALWSHSQKIGTSTTSTATAGAANSLRVREGDRKYYITYIFIVSPVHWFINLKRLFVLYNNNIFSDTKSYYIILVLCVCMESLNVSPHVWHTSLSAVNTRIILYNMYIILLLYHVNYIQNGKIYSRLIYNYCEFIPYTRRVGSTVSHLIINVISSIDIFLNGPRKLLLFFFKHQHF